MKAAVSEQNWSPELGLLAALEARVDGARAAVFRAAEALAEIQERRLYKAAGYRSFNAYLLARFDLSLSRAYQLIDLARLHRDIPVENEYQARRIAPQWRRDPGSVKDSFNALLGSGASEKDAVTELARSCRPAPTPKVKKRRLTVVHSEKVAQPTEVYVVVAIPLGQEPPSVAVASDKGRAAELRQSFVESARYRRVVIQVCEIES